MEITPEMLQGGNQDEEVDGVKDMEDFRQMKYNKDDTTNAVETKKADADFDPNYGVRVG